MTDFQDSINSIKSTLQSEELSKYEKWAKEFGE